MKVFKFGGASVDSISRIRNLPAILRKYDSEKILIVISAMGKTTNALEKVAEAFYAGDTVKSAGAFRSDQIEPSADCRIIGHWRK